MRIVVALLIALVGARLALDLTPDLRRAVEVGISILSLAIVQGWMLQSLLVWATGGAASMRAACSTCAMVMFLGAMLTLLVVFLLLAVLGSGAAGVSFVVLPLINAVVSVFMYRFVVTSGFCERRLGVPALGSGRGLFVALIMSVMQLLLYVLVYLFMRP
ncbi:MAG: hypothetical protein VX727_00385 [Planctomycetota bacterium]|nr:hypothetical protein [Planctomycetota bacterium]